MDKGHVQQEQPAIQDVIADSFEEELSLSARRGTTSSSTALAVPSQPGRRAGAQHSSDFNVSEGLLAELHALDGASVPRERPPEFFFRIVAAGMQKTHTFLGKQVVGLDHDCVVAGLQAKARAQDKASPSVALSPCGLPRPMKLHLHISTSTSDESSLRVWGRGEMHAADLCSSLLTVSSPRGVDEWILARLSESAMEDPSADGLCLKTLQSLIDALQNLAMAEAVVLLKHRGWFLRELAPGQKFEGWMPQSEKYIWCRDGLPKHATLVCLVLSPKMFQLGLELLPLNQPVQYYQTLLALLRAGSSELGRLKPGKGSRYYTQLQNDPSNWAAAEGPNRSSLASAVQRPQPSDAFELEDDRGYTGHGSSKSDNSLLHVGLDVGSCCSAHRLE